jgi:hypothetical protein
VKPPNKERKRLLALNFTTKHANLKLRGKNMGKGGRLGIGYASLQASADRKSDDGLGRVPR